MKKVCTKCEYYEKFAENAGYCNKYQFQIHVSLAKKARICDGIENTNIKET